MSFTEQQLSTVFDSLKKANQRNESKEEAKKKAEKEYVDSLTPKSRRKYLLKRMKDAKEEKKNPPNPIAMLNDPDGMEKIQKYLGSSKLDKKEVMKATQAILSDREAFSQKMNLLVDKKQSMKLADEIVKSIPELSGQ